MIQKNANIQHHCDKQVIQAILNYPEFYELPSLYDSSWDGIPKDEIELNKRINMLREIDKKDIKREPHHFMSILIDTQPFERIFSEHDSIHNEEIVKQCVGYLTNKNTIRQAEIKVALIQKYIRFMKNALNSYSEIIKEYDNLSKKTHITQTIIDEELCTKLAVAQMNQSVQTQKLVDINIFIPEDTKIPYPVLDVSKRLGIPFKELKAKYPLYRSKFNIDTKFTYCIWTYAYYFFINNFVYEKKEEGAIFAYSSMEYIKYQIHNSIYNPPIKSNYRSILDGIMELKQNQPYHLQYQDIVLCDYILSEEAGVISFYFPKSHTAYKELIS